MIKRAPFFFSLPYFSIYVCFLSLSSVWHGSSLEITCALGGGLFTLFLVCLHYLLHLLLNLLWSSSKGSSPQITAHAESSSTDHDISGSEMLNEHRSVVIREFQKQICIFVEAVCLSFIYLFIHSFFRSVTPVKCIDCRLSVELKPTLTTCHVRWILGSTKQYSKPSIVKIVQKLSTKLPSSVVVSIQIQGRCCFLFFSTWQEFSEGY